jgi:hypothetical protein
MRHGTLTVAIALKQLDSPSDCDLLLLLILLPPPPESIVS